MLLKVLSKGHVFFSEFVDLIEALGVTDALDDSAVRPRCEDLVWFQPDWYILDLENLIDLGDELDRELLLSNIVLGFDNHSHEPP